MGVKGVSDPIFNEVTVACVPSAVNYFASDVIRKFSKDYPNTRVKLVDSSSNDVLLSTARGDADFGVNFVGSLDPEVEFGASSGREVCGGMFERSCNRAALVRYLVGNCGVSLYRTREGVR